MSFMFPLVWILFFLIKEALALAQRTKGKLFLKYFQMNDSKIYMKIHKYTGILKQREGFLVCPPSLSAFLPASWAFHH